MGGQFSPVAHTLKVGAAAGTLPQLANSHAFGRGDVVVAPLRQHVVANLHAAPSSPTHTGVLRV